jgi:predicted Fe-S protein YdhL (DUF1289 family)
MKNSSDFECPRCGHCCKTDLARVGEVGVWGEWVGLTDEERREIFDACETTDRGYVLAMAEAKLKEKNKW